MLFLYLLFYKTSWSVSASYQPLVMVSLVQWGALLWQVCFCVQGHVGIPASGTPNIGCTSAIALIQGLEERGYFMIILVPERPSGVGSQKLRSCGPHWWRLGRFSVAEAVESIGVVRPLRGPHGESCWGSPAPLFSMEKRSKRSCWAEGWSDSGKILPSLSYVAILFFRSSTRLLQLLNCISELSRSYFSLWIIVKSLFMWECYWMEVHMPNTQWDQTIPKPRIWAEKGLLQGQARRWVICSPPNSLMGLTKVFLKARWGRGQAGFCKLLNVTILCPLKSSLMFL